MMELIKGKEKKMENGKERVAELKSAKERKKEVT